MGCAASSREDSQQQQQHSEEHATPPPPPPLQADVPDSRPHNAPTPEMDSEASHVEPSSALLRPPDSPSLQSDNESVQSLQSMPAAKERAMLLFSPGAGPAIPVQGEDDDEDDTGELRLLGSDPGSMAHYHETTFNIRSDDPYFTETREVVVAKSRSNSPHVSSLKNSSHSLSASRSNREEVLSLSSASDRKRVSFVEDSGMLESPQVDPCVESDAQLATKPSASSGHDDPPNPMRP
jgi:hypothetical protein